jgi:hypothetical protein
MMMSPQRAGVCSFRSLMAWMRANMELADYKRFKCDFKLQMLNDFVKASAMDPDVKVEDWRLIRRTHQSVCQAIIKLRAQKLVGDDYIKSVQGPLKMSAEWIIANKSCRCKKGPDSIDLKYEKCGSGQTIFNPHSLENPLCELITGLQSKDAMMQSCSFALEAFKEIRCSHPATIEKDLINAHELASNAWKGREDVPLHLGLINLTVRLPLERQFWEKAIGGQPKNAEALIHTLGELSNYFLKSCFTVPESSVINPEKVYVLSKIIHLQHLLCRLGHPKSVWEDVEFPRLENDAFFCNFPDLQMNSEMAQMKKAATDRKPTKSVTTKKGHGYSCTRSYRSICLIDPDEIVGDEKSVGLKMAFETCQYGIDNPIENIIREKYPEIIAAIQKSEMTYQSLPTKCQDAHIFASSLLPPWIKAMRDSALSYEHLIKSGVGPLEALDRDLDIRPKYLVQDDKEKKSSTIFVSLQGVNSDIYHHPDSKRVKENNLSFAGVYTKQPSSLIKALKTVASATNNHAESLLLPSELAKIFFEENKKYIHDLEFKEILHPLVAGELKHMEVLEYFTKHPEKLKEREYQILLHVMLFGEGLTENLSVNGYPELLEAFIKKNYQFLVNENALQAAVFFLKVSSQLKSFCPKQPFFQESLTELQKLSHRKGIDAETKSVVLAELVAELGEKEVLSEQEIRWLLAGSIYLKENTIETKDLEDPDTMRRANQALPYHTERILQTLKMGDPNQKLLNAILCDLRAGYEKGKTWIKIENIGGVPSFATSDGEFVFYPLFSELHSSSGQNLLPLTIRENSLFRRHFPTIEKGTVHPGGVFSFKDQYQHETLVHMHGDQIVIEKQLKLFENDQGFYRLLPSASLLMETERGEVKSPIGSRSIVQDNVLWQSLAIDKEGACKIVALDPKTGKACYEFRAVVPHHEIIQKKIDEERNNEIAQIREKHFLDFLIKSEIEKLPPKKIVQPNSCIQIYEVRDLRVKEEINLGKTSRLLSHFEDPSYIHEWYNDQNKLVKLELPRFDLTFVPHTTEPGKFACKQFPGYHLNLAKEVPGLGVHLHYIVLENSKGECKVLLPVQKLLKPQKLEVLLPRYDIERNLERGNQKVHAYFTYHLGKKGALSHKSREANLYLAQVMATAQQYNKAVACLKKHGEKLSLYSPAEKSTLECITKIADVTGDKSGNGIAIRLFAFYLLMKNGVVNHQEFSEREIEAVRKEYNLYLNHYGNATAVKLTRAQEIFLLKALLQQEYDAVHYLRLHELDTPSARKLNCAKAQKNSEKTTGVDSDIDYFELSTFFESKDRDTLDELYMTRFHGNLKQHFNHYYEMARTGTNEEREWLKTAMPFVRTADEGAYSGLAKIFEAILDKPKDFDEIPKKTHNSIKDHENREEWKRNVRSAAKEYCKRSRALEQPAIDLSVRDLTAKHYHLDKKTSVQPDIILNYPMRAALAEQCYFKEVQKPLAKKLISHWGGMNDKMNTFVQMLKSDKKALLIDYLCSEINNTLAAQTFIESLDKDIQNVVESAREMIPRLRPLCFKAEQKKGDPSQVEACRETIQQIKLTDPVAKKEQDRLINDLAALPPSTTYQLNSDEKHLEKSMQLLNEGKELKKNLTVEEVNLAVLRKILDSLDFEGKQCLNDLKVELLNLANQEIDSQSVKNLNQIHKWAGKQKAVSLDELIVFYARRNASALCQRNPALTVEDAGKIFTKIENYLLYATRDQQRARSEENCKSLKRCSKKGKGWTALKLRI